MTRVAMAVLLAVAGSVLPALAQSQRKLPAAPPQIEACAPCHGIDGIARDVEVPHLAGQNVVYLLNQLRAFHNGQRKHKEMNYMSRRMTEQEMESLADYYAALPRS
ncbi:MAG: cytochrome c [Alsobacter sp.]